MVRADNRNPSHETPDPVWYAHYAWHERRRALSYIGPLGMQDARVKDYTPFVALVLRTCQWCQDYLEFTTPGRGSPRRGGPQRGGLNQSTSSPPSILLEVMVCPTAPTLIRPASRLLRRLHNIAPGLRRASRGAAKSAARRPRTRSTLINAYFERPSGAPLQYSPLFYGSRFCHKISSWASSDKKSMTTMTTMSTMTTRRRGLRRDASLERRPRLAPAS